MAIGGMGSHCIALTRHQNTCKGMIYLKYVVCYSGGHSSALAAIETVRKYGKDNVILLNHNISSKVEHEDIKRFKQEVSNYLGVPITYANYPDYEDYPPLEINKRYGMIHFSAGFAICTHYLKTKPFHDWLDANWSENKDHITVIYGFDADEDNRINRRTDIMRAMGYKTDYPLARWERTIHSTEEIGISPPITYKIFKHANCIGCLKAGRQHWYAVYCMRRDIFDEAKAVEEAIGHSIIKGTYLKDLEPKFEDMLNNLHICCNEHTNAARFWADVEATLPEQCCLIPCDCSF